MIKYAISGYPDSTAQQSIDRLHNAFLESHHVDEPEWAEEYFRYFRDRAFDHEVADRMSHGQCTGERSVL